MKNIIKFQQTIEHLAGEVYQQAAINYADDPKLKKFLEHLAEDEAWHFHVMGSAADFLASGPDFVAAISVDDETIAKVVKNLTDLKEGLVKKTLPKAEFIEKVFELEFSEWNDIFIYIVNNLKEKTSEFEYPAEKIQSHINEIEDFLKTDKKYVGIAEKIKSLPLVWVENILIVDDEEVICDLLKILFNRSGNIDIAHNGQEALKLIERKYYKLIISDIDMPIMDGLELYKKAVAKFPKLNQRFLFMTGCLSPDREIFFKEECVACIKKPINISTLREKSSKIILLESKMNISK